METNTRRGQTEPLAALVAVAAICVAVSVYAGFASALLPDIGGDRRTDRATLDSVWADASTDGVLPTDGPLADRIDAETLPRGYHVVVRVTVVGGDGRLETVGHAAFDADGSRARLEPPERASTRSRPVPVRVDDGEILPGTLGVVIWDD